MYVWAKSRECHVRIASASRNTSMSENEMKRKMSINDYHWDVE